MRISDWSSDVCSSDLSLDEPQRVQRVAVLREEQATREHRGEVFIQRPNIFGREGTRFDAEARSEEHTSELQPLMRISYAVFCLKTKTNIHSTSSATLTPRR